MRGRRSASRAHGYAAAARTPPGAVSLAAEAIGVSARLAGSAADAVKAAADPGSPLSVEIVAADILHTSDIGVRLDVPQGEAARVAYQAVTAAAAAAYASAVRVDGALIEPDAPRRRWSASSATVAGLVPAVAIGGLFVEVLQDSALGPLPVTPGQAGRLLGRLRGRAVLDGVRGAASAGLDSLSAVIAWVSDLALALNDDLESLEVNPLLVAGTTIEALDAVVTWRERG